MVTETQADCLLSAIILFRFETDLICKKMFMAWRFFKGQSPFTLRRDKLIRGAKRGTYVKNQLKAKKSPVSHGSIIDIDQQEFPS